MRFVSFVVDDESVVGARFGAIVENRVVDLSVRMPEHGSLKAVVAAGALVRATDIAAESSADYALKDIAYLPPIVAPGKIICASVATDSGCSPRFQLRSPDSLVGHEQPLTRPANAPLEAGCALALIIGHQARNLTEAECLTCLGGLALANDGQAHAAADSALARLSPGSGSLGPCLVTMDELPELDQLQLDATVNGQPAGQLQSDALPLPALLSELSRATVLRGGDVVIVSAALDKGGVLLDVGDELRLASESLGTLRNDVRAEAVETQSEA